MSTPPLLNTETLPGTPPRGPPPSQMESRGISVRASPRKTKMCRNIGIYGFCKFADKGCEFLHDVSSPPTSAIEASIHAKFVKSMTAVQAIDAPEFVPFSASLEAKAQNQRVAIDEDASLDVVPPSDSMEINARAPVFTPSSISISDNAPEFTIRASAPAFAPASAMMSASAAVFTPDVESTLESNVETFSSQIAGEAQGVDASTNPTAGHDGNQYLQQTEGEYYYEGAGYEDDFDPYSAETQQRYNVNDLSQAVQQVDLSRVAYNQGNYSADGQYYSAGNPYAQADTSNQLFTAPAQQPLEYHHYASPLPRVANPEPYLKSIHHFFISDHIREDLQRKSDDIHKGPDLANSSLPAELHSYHSFQLLEEHRENSEKVFGFPTSVYRGVSAQDGQPYVLRRIEGFRLQNETAMQSVEAWRRIRHPNVVSLREAFTTKAFGDYSLMCVYDYHPLSTTLQSRYLDAQSPAPAQEKVIWSYIIQLASAMNVIHAAGLAVRVLEPSKVLITGENRIRLNCCGIFDLLTFEANKGIAHYQQDDLLHLGQLIVALACGSLTSVHNLPKSIDYVSKAFSVELKNVILYLLSKPSSYKTIDDVIAMLGPKILVEINNAHACNDVLEMELGRELENGRVVRLLCKLGFINERPEFDMDPSWSETGDRYLLKLFRDYVFHQVNEHGNPLLDMAHVLVCLNKLDAGVDERIMLMSRDEKSCLIVSYKELKHCIQSTFKELRRSPTL